MSTDNVVALSAHKDKPPVEKLPPFYWVHREYDRGVGRLAFTSTERLQRKT